MRNWWKYSNRRDVLLKSGTGVEMGRVVKGMGSAPMQGGIGRRAMFHVEHSSPRPRCSLAPSRPIEPRSHAWRPRNPLYAQPYLPDSFCAGAEVGGAASGLCAPLGAAG